jgi:hypothetical protein
MNGRRKPRQDTDAAEAAGRYWVDTALAEGMDPWLVIRPDGSRYIGIMKGGVVPELLPKGKAIVAQELLNQGRVWSRRQEGHMVDKAPARDINRFREIARQSGDNALLSDGPVSPDADLLDICSEALHLLVQIEKSRAFAAAIGQRREEEWNRLWAESDQATRKAEPILRRIRKIRAETAAGIYAKALVVRASRTGAPMLAKSLAIDLIGCPGLRASLWPAEVAEAG